MDEKLRKNISNIAQRASLDIQDELGVIDTSGSRHIRKAIIEKAILGVVSDIMPESPKSKFRDFEIGDQVDVLDNGSEVLSNVLLEEIKTNLLGWKKTYRCRGVLTPTSTGSAWIADVWEIRASPEIELRLHVLTEEIPPKSKFMAEWESLNKTKDAYTPEHFNQKIGELIDKYKDDKKEK